MMHSNCQNIWAVGRNYLEHIKELNKESGKEFGGDQKSPQNPMIFLKSGSSLVANGASFCLPKFSNEVHHEVEIALRFGPHLKIDAFTIALDLTARDIQNILKAAGHPWTLAKSFKNSCPIGPWYQLSQNAEPSTHAELKDLSFTLHVGSQLRQQGHVREMIFDMQKICDYLREHFPVLPGDIVLTGTPSGVGKINPGDVLTAEIKNFVKAHWSVEGSHV